jgi:hypothetical protein
MRDLSEKTRIPLVTMGEHDNIIPIGIAATNSYAPHTTMSIPKDESCCRGIVAQYNVNAFNKDASVIILDISPDRLAWFVPKHRRWIYHTCYPFRPTPQKAILLVDIPHCIFVMPLRARLISSNFKLYSISQTGNKVIPFPYGNVHASGRVCWGEQSNSLWTVFERCMTASQVPNMYDLQYNLDTVATYMTEFFFSSPFNRDLSLEPWKNILATPTPPRKWVLYALYGSAEDLYVGAFRRGEFNVNDLDAYIAETAGRYRYDVIPYTRTEVRRGRVKDGV